MLGPIKNRKEIFKSLSNTQNELNIKSNINKLSILKHIDNNFGNKKSLLSKTVNKKVNFNFNNQEQNNIFNNKNIFLSGIQNKNIVPKLNKSISLSPIIK